MKQVMFALGLILTLLGCVSTYPPVPEKPACASPDTEETDGGVGGTGHRECPREATE